MTERADGAGGPDERDGQRLDQWLWFARLTKSRTLAQALIARGKVRVNKQKAERASHWLKIGDTLTFSSGPRVRIVSVKAIGKRRGPATEAQALFEELTPAPERTKSSPNAARPAEVPALPDPAFGVRDAGAGRPTKRDRRATERLKDRFGES